MITPGNATANGTVIMATQYNCLAPPFTSKQFMENYDFANSTVVSSTALHGVECDPKKNAGSPTQYVRTAAVPAGQDAKTYDMGVFQLATAGAYANQTIGELWVSYKVTLRKTKVMQPGANPALQIYTAYVAGAGTSINNLLGLTQSNIFVPVNTYVDTTTSKTGYDASGGATTVTTNGAANTIISIPSYISGGSYQLSIAYTKSAATDPGTIVLTPVGITVNQTNQTNGAASGYGQTDVYFTVISPAGQPAYLTFSWPTNVVTSHGSLLLTQLNVNTPSYVVA